MSGYTPIFDTVFEGSLCGQYPDTAAWLFLLALCDRNGHVDKTPQYISAITGMPLQVLQGCIERFTQPDPDSRTTEEEGRRLVLIDPARPWGWRIVNHGKYRERARKKVYDDARTSSGEDAERKRLEREVCDDARSGTDSSKLPLSRGVPTCPDVSRAVPLSESEAEASPSESERARARETEGAGAESQTGLEAWREVAGVDVEAMETWLGHCGGLDPPKRITGVSRIHLAKTLASMGSAAVQRRAVQFCSANGYRSLRHADGAESARGGPPDREAIDAWDRLIASGGADRDARAQRAIVAVGGWPRIRLRTDAEAARLRAEFCRAYSEAVAA